MALSPEQAQEQVELHGSQREAARAAGVPYSTFRHWLRPHEARERRRRNWRDHKERNEAYMARYRAENALAINQQRSLYQAEKALQGARQKAEDYA